MSGIQSIAKFSSRVGVISTEGRNLVSRKILELFSEEISPFGRNDSNGPVVKILRWVVVTWTMGLMSDIRVMNVSARRIER